uniref:C2H2-type domain-containing protein n=1 Tax=Salarias fasciatus TaxID=181472 RepID=A0A672IBW9_SALFA
MCALLLPDCHSSCLTCSGPDAGSCSGCREDRRPDGSGHCVPPPAACSPRQYAERDGGCRPCHKHCHGCRGPGRSQCLSCGPRHLLLNGTCMDGCPEGYYEDGRRCRACHAACQSCVGEHSHQCLVCAAHFFREGKECVESCQHGHYGDAASRACERCDPSCGECLGGGEDGCLSCSPGLLFLRRDGRCAPSCPPGHYHDGEHRTCEPCHASCRTCSGTHTHTHTHTKTE